MDNKKVLIFKSKLIEGAAPLYFKTGNKQKAAFLPKQIDK
jgi:hypothetical protein